MKGRHCSTEELRAVALRDAPEDDHAHARSCVRCGREAGLIRALGGAREEDDGDCLRALEVALLADPRVSAQLAGSAPRRHAGACVACAAEVEALRRADERLRDTGLRGALARLGASALRGLSGIEAELRRLAAFEMPQLVLAHARGAAVAAPPDVVAGLRAYAAGRYGEASRRLEAAVSEPGAPPEARFFLAACRARESRHAEAVALLREAVSARPLAEYRWHLAQQLLLEGRGGEALDQLERVARLAGSRKERARQLSRQVRELLEEDSDG